MCRNVDRGISSSRPGLRDREVRVLAYDSRCNDLEGLWGFRRLMFQWMDRATLWAEEF